MTRWILICCAIVSLVACDDSSNSATLTNHMAFQPDAAIVAQIAPQTFFFGVPGAVMCPAGTFSPSFALVITPFGSLNASLNSATFRLIDGTTAGGPSVTFPQPQLTRMFGTTLIAQGRTFPFVPAFQCPTVLPRAMHAEVVLDNGQRLTASMALQ